MANADPQMAMDEQIVENKELEQLLEDREIAKGALGEARRKHDDLLDLAKSKIADLRLKDGDVVRIGRFRIKQTGVPGKSVAFETKASTRLTINPVSEEE